MSDEEYLLDKEYNEGEENYVIIRDSRDALNHSTGYEIDTISLSTANSNLLKQYKQEIIESFMKVIVLLYIVFGLLFILSRAVLMLNPFPPTLRLYDIMFFLICAFNILVFGLTMCYHFINRHNINPPLTGDRWYFLFTIMVPLFIMAGLEILINTFIACKDNGNAYYYWMEFGLIFSAIFFPQSNISVANSSWQSISLGKFIKSLIVVGCVTSCIFNIIMRNTYAFIGLVSCYLNVSFVTCQNKSDFQNIGYLNNYVFSIGTTLFFLFTTVYLTTISYQTNRPTVSGLRLCSNNINLTTIITSSIVIIMPLIAVMMLILSNQFSHIKLIPSILTGAFGSLIYIYGSICAVLKLNEVIKWEKREDFSIESNLFDRIFIWGGLLGELFNFVRSVEYSIVSDFTMFNILFWTFTACSFLQTIFQTCLIEISLDREWNTENVTVNRMRKTILYSFVLMAANVGALIITVYKDKLHSISSCPKNLTMDLFHLYSLYFPQTLLAAQKLHAIVYFWKLFTATERYAETNSLHIE